MIIAVTGLIKPQVFVRLWRIEGHALFVKDGQVTYAYNFLGIPPEDHIVAPVPGSGKHVLGVEFTKERLGEFREGIGPLKLNVDDELVAEQEIRTVMGHFSLCGEGLCIGYDGGDAVSSEYAGSGFGFTSGEIVKVVFDIADDAHVDVEAHLAAAMARLTDPGLEGDDGRWRLPHPRRVRRPPRVAT